jgi:hypothetical protein
MKPLSVGYINVIIDIQPIKYFEDRYLFNVITWNRNVEFQMNPVNILKVTIR